MAWMIAIFPLKQAGLGCFLFYCCFLIVEARSLLGLLFFFCFSVDIKSKNNMLIVCVWRGLAKGQFNIMTLYFEGF